MLPRHQILSFNEFPHFHTFNHIFQQNDYECSNRCSIQTDIPVAQFSTAVSGSKKCVTSRYRASIYLFLHSIKKQTDVAESQISYGDSRWWNSCHIKKRKHSWAYLIRLLRRLWNEMKLVTNNMTKYFHLMSALVISGHFYIVKAGVYFLLYC